MSELYFATVGFAGATDGGAPTDSRYQHREQAFLDANDVTKYVFSCYYLLSLIIIIILMVYKSLFFHFLHLVSLVTLHCIANIVQRPLL